MFFQSLFEKFYFAVFSFSSLADVKLILLQSWYSEGVITSLLSSAESVSDHTFYLTHIILMNVLVKMVLFGLM